jgi:hypothetical protein
MPKSISALVARSITPPWLEHVIRLRNELKAANETIAELRREIKQEREMNYGVDNAATIAPAASD